MKPRFYIDINVKVADKGAASLPHTSSKIISLLHPYFSKNPKKYAIDLPFTKSLFTCIRVFGETMEDIVSVGKFLQESKIDKYGLMTFPEAVPVDFYGQGVMLNRYRIASHNSRTQACRFNRLKYAEEKELPYFMLKSKSNGQPFSLHIERNLVDRYQEQECFPNGYGLGSKERLVLLPVL